MTADYYAAAGRGWATGAELVYGPLAAEFIAVSPHPLAGHTVLDAGADTGTASWALAAQPSRWTYHAGGAGRPARSHRRQPAGVTTHLVQAGRSHAMTFRASWR